jgi:hypothetical protein
MVDHRLSADVGDGLVAAEAPGRAAGDDGAQYPQAAPL